jgi:hypothetical protein
MGWNKTQFLDYWRSQMRTRSRDDIIQGIKRDHKIYLTRGEHAEAAHIREVLAELFNDFSLLHQHGTSPDALSTLSTHELINDLCGEKTPIYIVE